MPSRIIFIYNLPTLNELWNLTYFFLLLTLGDLWRPRERVVTPFLKSWRQERHFDKQFIHFQWSFKFDPKWPKIWPQTKMFQLKKNSDILLIILSFWWWNSVQSTKTGSYKSHEQALEGGASLLSKFLASRLNLNL